MSLTREEVRHVAQLARITLTSQEEDLFTQQLSSIVEYINQLKEVDVKNNEYGYQVEGLENVKQEDEILVQNEETRKRLLDAMPDRAGDLLKVKGVFDDKQ